MLKPFLRNVSGKPSKSDITLFTGGLNTCYDKTMIRDNQMAYMWNMTLNNVMSMTTRSNRTSLASFLENTTNWGTGEIQKMFVTSDKTLLTIEKHDDETLVYELKKQSTFLTKDYIGEVENSPFYSITECRDSGTKYFMISTLHKLYKVSKDDFDETLEDVTSDPPIVGVLAAHKNRLFVANGIDLFISKLREYDDFTVTEGDEESGHQIRITNANGDIKALVSYDDKLIILCERSMHILYGDSPLSEVNQFTIVDLNNGLGCISDETWTICNKQLYWLDTDMSVYRYNGAGIVKISEEYGSDNYASYGGIKGITYNTTRLKEFIMSSYGDCVYIDVCRKLEKKEQEYNFRLPQELFLGAIGEACNYIYGTKDNWKLHKALAKIVLNGTEEYTKINNGSTPLGYYFSTPILELGYYAQNKIPELMKCSNLKVVTNSLTKLNDGTITLGSNKNRIIIAYSGTVEELKNYFRNNNTIVIYTLETEKDEDITDTTLISQLNNIADNMQTYEGGTIVFTIGENISPNIQFDYVNKSGIETSPNSNNYTLNYSLEYKNKGNIKIGYQNEIQQDGIPTIDNPILIKSITGDNIIKLSKMKSFNDTLLVYNTKNRVWWAEDGAFSHMCMWETDSQTPFYYKTDYLIGAKYNNDIVILNALQNTDTDYLFNMETRHFDNVPIEYGFETKTWNLGTIKREKTLTNLWFQANAEGRVAVSDYWNEHNVWDEAVTELDDNYLVLGNLKKVGVRHNIQNPTIGLHQGTERQRFIIPRMYMQKINAFSVRVEGTGYAEFYMMEKEWRIK